jgi:hypothetical protein
MLSLKFELNFNLINSEQVFVLAHKVRKATIKVHTEPNYKKPAMI